MKNELSKCRHLWIFSRRCSALALLFFFFGLSSFKSLANCKLPAGTIWLVDIKTACAGNLLGKLIIPGQ